MWLAVNVKRLDSEGKCNALEADENANFGDLLEKVKEINDNEEIEEVSYVIFYGF